MKEIDTDMLFKMNLPYFRIPLASMFCIKCNDYTQGFLGYCVECCRKGEHTKEEVISEIKRVYGDIITHPNFERD